jgi:hypothetical protein
MSTANRSLMSRTYSDTAIESQDESYDESQPGMSTANRSLMRRTYSDTANDYFRAGSHDQSNASPLPYRSQGVITPIESGQ